MPKHSLCRIISKLGVMSRKQSAEAILAGKVMVDGVSVTRPGFKASEDSKIFLNGKLLQKQEKIYILLNKPVKYVVTRNDEKGRKTIYKILKLSQWIFPVGRLDYDTSGLLILTNDSKFSEFLASPDSHVWKTYVAKVKGKMGKEEIEVLEKGIRLSEGVTKPAMAKLISSSGKISEIEIKICEGKNRQIRRMLGSLGKEVIGLKRVAIGDLRDDKLKPGEYRNLTQDEVRALCGKQ